jgi:hypothetical protein
MVRVYYGGPVTPATEVAGLVNPDGTHRALGGGQAKATFLKNEKLTPLPNKLRSTAEIEATLTNNGPIIFNWAAPQGEHASVIVAVLDTDVVYHDPNIGPNQRMSIDMFVIKTAAGFNGSSGAMLTRDPNTRPRWAFPPQEEFVHKKTELAYPLPWPTGWWHVYDCNTWYYYLAKDSSNNGIAFLSKIVPSPTSTDPPAKAHIRNTGTWTRPTPKTLIITWKKVEGTKTACVETFSNALDDCKVMNATSNLYFALTATRYPS